MVQRKLDDGLYKSPEEFVGDVRLIWANAKLYNPPGAPENARIIRIIRIIQTRQVARIIRIIWIIRIRPTRKGSPHRLPGWRIPLHDDAAMRCACRCDA